MITINPYISFESTCEAAFNFYKSVFGGEFMYVGRYKDMPSEQPIPESEKEKIMHICLPISKECMLMGADMCEMFGGNLKPGDNISLSVNAETEEDARRIFSALSAGGQITMPLENTFWGALFGMLVDKFGINWMVNFDCNQEKKQ